MAGTTNFEEFDHAQLRDMVRNTDGGKVLSRSAELKAAAQVLKDLSAALKSHVDNVGWEGPAAESFKAWAGNLQKSAALLGDYSDKAGDAMHQAGEALCTAQVAVPEPPRAEIQLLATANSQKVPLYTELQLGPGQSIDDFMKSRRPDWVTAAQATTLSRKIETEHREAIQQMVRLTQAYSAATATLNSLEEPTLPGTPNATRYDTADYSPGGGGSATGTGGAVRQPQKSVGSDGRAYWSASGSHSGGSVTPRQPVSGPHRPDTPVHADPISSHSGGYVPLPQGSGSSTPSSASSLPMDRPGTGIDSVPTVPPVQKSPADGDSLPFEGRGGFPGGSGGTGEGGGNHGFPVGGPIPVGGLPGKGGPDPSRSGGSISGRPVPFGGSSIPGKTGMPGPPTGTVVGSREVKPGRAGATGMPGMGGIHPGAAGHGVGGSGGATRGRGLTSTPGGIVGGRKGPSTSGEFTPGGTGLRKRAGAVEGSARAGQNGMMAPGMHGGGTGGNERNRRQRADYLHEDEETWISGTPHSNPNVVE